jgi:Ca2+/Na+ antiporter
MILDFILFIFVCSAIYACIGDFALPFSVKALLMIVCAVIFAYFFYKSYYYVVERQQRLRDLTFIEYLNERKSNGGYIVSIDSFETPGIQELIAITTSNLNVRSGPSTQHRSLTILPKESKVNTFILFPPKGHNRSDRRGDWIQIGYKDGVGWVHGGYLRPATGSDHINNMIPNAKFIFNITFPEDTALGKILAVLVSTPAKIISYYLILLFMRITKFRFIIYTQDDHKMMATVGPLCYFLIKNDYFVYVSAGEHFVMFPILLLISTVSSLPANIIIEYVNLKLNIE